MMKTLQLAAISMAILLCSSCSTIYQTRYSLANLNDATYTHPEDLVSGNDTLAIGYTLSGNLRFTNKTDSPIVIDLTNSFFGDGGGMKPLYINTVTTTSSSNTRGGSLNLGGVASALGAPSGVTAIAYGTTIGGGTTTGTTVQTFQDKYIIIPPNSFREVDEGYYISKGPHNGSFEYVITYGIGNEPAEYIIRRDKINFETQIVGTNVWKGAGSQGVIQISKNEYRTVEWTPGGFAGYISGIVGGICVGSGLIGVIVALICGGF